MGRFDYAPNTIDSEDTFTLTVVRSGDEVLLGQKTRGFGKGKLVLPGGKDRYGLSSAGLILNPGAKNAAREVFEEVRFDADPRLFKELGTLHIATEEDNKDIQIYQVESRHKRVAPSDELNPLEWYPETNLPYDKMPEDYKLWLPHVLAGYAIMGFLTTEENEVIDAKLFRQRIEPLGRLELV